MVRSLFEPGEFIEVHIDAAGESANSVTPRFVQKARDGVIKGLYRDHFTL